MVEYNIEDALWKLLLDKPGSYEFKDEVIWRAIRAIKTRDVDSLYRRIVFFHYDGLSQIEEWEAETVREYMKVSGIAEFVTDHIRSLSV